MPDRRRSFWKAQGGHPPYSLPDRVFDRRFDATPASGARAQVLSQPKPENRLTRHLETLGKDGFLTMAALASYGVLDAGVRLRQTWAHYL